MRQLQLQRSPGGRPAAPGRRRARGRPQPGAGGRPAWGRGAEPLGLLVGAVRRRIKQAVDARARPLGLSPQQFWVLVAIRELEGGPLGALAARQRMDAPTASRVVAGLVRRGLARLPHDPQDARRGRLVLTPRGRALAAALVGVARDVRRATVRGLTPGELAVTGAVLRRVLANLERFDPRPGG